jgi:hypothetical protein
MVSGSHLTMPYLLSVEWKKGSDDLPWNSATQICNDIGVGIHAKMVCNLSYFEREL